MNGRALLTAGMALGVLTSAAADQTPALPELLKLGGAYVAEYARKTSGVILEEQFMLIEVSARGMTVPRRITSDVVIIELDGEPIAMRDAFAIDTVPLRERRPRINELLKEPTGAGWIQAQEYARQSAVHFALTIVLRASEPVLALKFLAAAQQPGLRYRLDGRKQINGTAVVGLRFDEPRSRGATYLLKTPGYAWASGRLWLDPATGAVHQTELWLESKTEIARVTVTYARDPGLQVLLPKEMTGTFEERQLGAVAGASGADPYNIRQDVESTVTYSNARHLPIDLSKLRGRHP
jgi:hypothetical protein